MNTTRFSCPLTPRPLFFSDCIRFTRHTHVFHQVDVLVSVSVAHHFVETEFILSEEQRQGAVLEGNGELMFLITHTHDKATTLSNRYSRGRSSPSCSFAQISATGKRRTFTIWLHVNYIETTWDVMRRIIATHDVLTTLAASSC